jgi:hypothetical protein
MLSSLIGDTYVKETILIPLIVLWFTMCLKFHETIISYSDIIAEAICKQLSKLPDVLSGGFFRLGSNMGSKT